MKLFDLLALGKLKKEDLPQGVYKDKDGVLTLTWQAIVNNKDNQAFPKKEIFPK